MSCQTPRLILQVSSPSLGHSLINPQRSVASLLAHPEAVARVGQCSEQMNLIEFCALL